MRTTLVNLGLLLSLLNLSACRFGNYVEDAPDGSGILTRYYETQPESLILCATSGGTTRCASAATNRTPSFLSGIFTNPVRLVMDTASGNAIFTPYNSDSIWLQTFVKADQSIDFFGSGTPETLWNDTRCKSQLYVEEKGTLGTGGTYTTSGTPLPLTGRLSLQVQVAQFFDAATPGDCDATLVAMRDCLNNASSCGGSSSSANLKTQQQIQAMFADYFSAGALTVSELPTLTNVSYVVQYR